MAPKTWNGGSDNWTTIADWSPTGQPASGDAVTISTGDPQVTTNVGTVASVTDSADLSLENGGVLTVTTFLTNTGTLGVDDAGFAGGSTLTVNGTLTNSGTFDLGNTSTSAQGGATKPAAATVGALVNTGGTINIASASTTVAATLTVNAVAGFSTAGELVGNVNLTSDASIVFKSGSIADIASNGELTLFNSDAYVSDAGATASNSALTGLATIEGGLTLYDGASVTISRSLTNAGTINVDQGFGVGGGGSSLIVTGTLTNSGTLEVGDPYADQSKSSTVTVNAIANSGTIIVQSLGSSVLSSLVVKGAAGFGTVGVLTGKVTLSNDAAIIFNSGGIKDIAATGVLTLNSADSTLSDASAPTTNSALTTLASIEGSLYLGGGTIAAAAALVDTGQLNVEGATFSTGGALTNSGQVSVDTNYTAGGSKLTVGGTLANTGTLQIGTTGNTTAATAATANALTNTGTINIRSSSSSLLASLTVKGAAGFGTAGVLTGNVNLQNDAAIIFGSGGITDIAVNSELSLDNSDSVIALSSAPTSNSALTGLATVEGSLYLEQGTTLALTGGLTDSGYIELQNTVTVTTVGGVTNSGTLNVDTNNYVGGSKLSIGGTLTNSSTVNIGNGNLDAATTVTAKALVDTGTLNLDGNSSTTGTATQATLSIGAAAGDGTAGHLQGAYRIHDDAVLSFASGSISTIDGTTYLYNNAQIDDAGATGSNSALTGLASISSGAGFALEGNETLTTTGALTVSGTLYVDDNNYAGGSKLTIGGTLTNGSTVNIGNGNLSTATTVTAKGLVDTGTLNLDGNAYTTGTAAQATLGIGAAAGDGTAGHLQGAYRIHDDAVLSFASGSISTIDGTTYLYNNAQIDDAGATGSNSALTGLTSISSGAGFAVEGNETLTTTGGLTVSGGLFVDDDNYAGGSKLTIGGTLTNGSTVNIGNGNLSAATTVTAKALVETGTLNLDGNAYTTGTAAQATLSIGAAAGDGTAGHLQGAYRIHDDAVLAFASGEITTIDGTTDLYNNAQIDDAGVTGSNSALTGLASISSGAGFALEGNETLTTTGGLTVSGGLFVDDDNYAGGSKLTIGGTLTNGNTVNIGNGNLSAATTVTAKALVDTGTLNLDGNAYTTGAATQATLSIGGAAGDGTTGHLQGADRIHDDAVLAFASGEITTIDGTTDLYNNAQIDDAGVTGSNSALTGLASISSGAGFALESNEKLTTTGGLTVSGGLFVDDDNYAGGSTLAIGGTLTDSNTVNIGDGNLSAATTVTAKGLVDTGTLNLDGNAYTTGTATQATLSIGAAAGDGTAGHLQGNDQIHDNAVLSFASGGISTIDGTTDLYNNAQIDDAGVTGANSALTGLASISSGASFALEGNETLKTTGGLSNAGGLYVDDNNYTGGSKLTIGGTLVNTGYAAFGNGNLSAASTIATTGLANSGTLNLNANGSGNAVLLAIAGAATNTGAFNLNAYSKVTDQGFTQGRTGSVSLQIQGQAAGQFAAIATTGAVTLNGGTLSVPVSNTSLAAGQSYNLFSLTASKLTGIFTTLNIAGTSGDGTSVSLGNGLYAGVVYGDAAGTLQLVVAQAATTTDNWASGTGTFATAGSWSSAVPTFYSDVAIGTAGSAAVTLAADATINSLALDAGDSLTSNSGTDFSIGSTIAVGTGAVLTIGGEMFAAGAATDNGSIVVTGSVADIRGGSSGTGTYTIGSAATLEFGAAASNTITFNAATATLRIDQPAQGFSGTLANLVVGDTIDLVGTSVSGATVSGNTLSVTTGAGPTLQYTLSNQQANTTFAVQSDGSGGSNLVLVSTTQPAFTAVAESPATGDYTTGKLVTFTLTSSVAAVVSGTPTLTLNDNGSASYDAGKSTSTSLVFDYTVAAGQNVASLAAQTLNVPGGSSIKDTSGNNFNLALNGLAQAGPVIDTTPPVVSINGSGGTVTTASQTIAGTVTDANPGTTVSLYDNGSTTALGTATVSNGAWSTTVTLASGANSLVAKDTDLAGNTGSSSPVSYTVAAALTPVIAAPATAAVGVGKATAIAGLSLSETGNTAGETFTVTLSDTNGLLAATGTGVSGTGTTALTVTGSLTQVNADLATVTDTDGTTPSDTITLGASDSFGNTAAGQTIAVTVNGLPVIASPATAVVGVGQGTAIAGVSLAESGTTSGETFTVTLGDTNGLLSATGTGVSGSGTKALTVTGSLSQVNADLATLKDTDGTTPSDTITLNATDSFGNKAAAASLAVTVNGLPVLAAPASVVAGVGKAKGIGGVTLSETGTTTAETFTVTLGDTNGLLSATGTGVSGSGTKALTVTGSLTQVNADLATLKDTDSTTPSDTITLNATDSFGNKAAAKTIAVTVNGLPVLTAPAAAAVGVGQASAIAGVSLAESGNTASQTFTVTLSDTNGLLAATGTGVSGSGTKALTLAGSLAQVNADLATLKDTDGTTPSDTIKLNATDGFGNVAAAKSIAVTVNGLPVLTAPATATVGMGQAGAIGGLGLAETGTTTGETFTVTLSDTNGLLAATGTGVSGSGTTSLTLAGSLAQVNADLATVTDTDGTTPSDTIALNATDSFGNKASASTAVTVNGLPVLAVPSSATVGVGQTNAVSGLSLSETGNTSGETFTVTLSDTNGLLSASGTGVSGSGTTSLTIAGSLAQVNSDLSTVTDDDATTPSDTITLGAVDSFGNHTAASTSVTVTVNGKPVIGSPATVVVGMGQPTAVMGVSLSESGTSTGETFTVSLSDTNGLLAATGTGVAGSGSKSLTVTGSSTQVNAALATLTDTDATTPSDTITLAASDSYGNAAPATSIAVTVNGLPVIASPATAVVGVGQGTAIAGVSLAESGTTSGETFTVTLGDTNGLLSATGTGVSGSGTKALTVTGSLSQVNADLATLKDTDGTTPSDTITLNATDSFGNKAAAASLAVTVNGLPVLAAPASVVAGVGKAKGIGGVTLSETGTTTAETFTVTLGDTNGLLSATGTGVSGSGTKALTVTGSLTQVNADLATLKDTDSTTPSDTITLNATDSFGNKAAAKTIAVTVNGLPVLTAPAAAAVGVGQASAIAGVSLAESGNTASQTFTVTLSDTNGLLAATGTGVSGSGTKALTLAGSLAQVNADLATLKDTDGTTPSDTIKLNATDGFGNVAAAKSIAVTVNGLPVLTAPATATVGMGQAGAIGGLGLAETGTTTGETFTVTLSDTNGLLAATGTGVSGSGTTSLTLAGSLAQVNADLATVTDTDGTQPSDTIALSATDSFGNKASASTAVTVIPVVTIAPVEGNDIINNAEAHASGGVPLSGTVAGIASGATFAVTVTDGAFSKSYTATVGTGGAWTATIPSADARTLPTGTATVSAGVTDTYGHASAVATQTVTVDEVAPKVTAVAGSIPGGNLTTGQTDIITLTMSKPVVVSGAPTLVLNDGGTAAYDAANSTATALAFDYTVTSSQTAQELATARVSLTSGAAVKDAAGNAALFAGAAANLDVAVNDAVTISGTDSAEILGPSGESVTFASGAAGTLILDNSASYTGSIAGLTLTDTLDLTDLSFAGTPSASYAGTTAAGVLTVTDGTRTAKLSLAGNYTTSTFNLSDDGNGGIDVVDPPGTKPTTPAFTSGNGGAAATYVIGAGSKAVGTVQATGLDGDAVSYALLDAKGNAVASTGGLAIDRTTGALAFTSVPAAGSAKVVVEAIDSAGPKATQALTVDVGSGTSMAGDTGLPGVTDTFVFSATTPSVQVQNFHALDGAVGGQTDPHGILALAHSLFEGGYAGQSGQSIAGMLASHSAQVGADTVITADTGAQIQLKTVNTASLLSQPKDFIFF